MSIPLVLMSRVKVYKKRLIIALICDLARYNIASEYIAIRSEETGKQPSDPLRGIPHYFYHKPKPATAP